jgi:hypothetical protein
MLAKIITSIITIPVSKANGRRDDLKFPMSFATISMFLAPMQFLETYLRDPPFMSELYLLSNFIYKTSCKYPKKGRLVT